MNIDEFYKDVVCKNIAIQVPEMNKRTGVAVRALPGITFQTDLEQEGFPLLSLRKIPFSFIPEVMWFCSGSKNINNFLREETKIWDSFAEEDGTVTSAYGSRWRKDFNIDQLTEVLQKLKNDQSSRHGVIMMWDPRIDLTLKQKNVPCPVMFTVNIIHGRLNLHLVIRSNDMILGAPTDYAGFAFLQYMLAQELNTAPGVFTASISNAHVYENQMYVVNELKKRQPQIGMVHLVLPANSFKRACRLDRSLVQEIKNGFSGYNPSPAITGIPIAI